MALKDKPADPVSAANAAFWKRVEEDEGYRRWMLTRVKDLIAICEFEDRKTELRKLQSLLQGKENANENSEAKADEAIGQEIIGRNTH